MNPGELKKFIKACHLAGHSPLIEGAHGVGKSDTIRQYAKENNMHCELLIMSLLDTADLCGIPRMVDIGGQHTTIWAAPSWLNRIVNNAWPTELAKEDLEFTDPKFAEKVNSELPEKVISREDLNNVYCRYTGTVNDNLYLHVQELVKYKKGKQSILFLDEMNRAPTDVLQPSLQLVLDKRMNDHQLPIGTMVVAAVNPSDGDYNTNEFDGALLDRFVHAEAKADIKSWLDWARSANVEQVVRDFLTEHPDRLHYTSKDGKSSATPRSWTALARTMSKIDQIPSEIHFQLMKGHIGQELASQFLSYYNNYFKVVKMDEIEALISKTAKRTTDIDKLSKAVAKLIKDQEVIQKQELAEQFYAKYLDDKVTDKLPLIVYLDAVELETLNGFLKSKKDADSANYSKLAKIDGELNNKNLFRKITTKAQAK